MLSYQVNRLFKKVAIPQLISFLKHSTLTPKNLGSLTVADKVLYPLDNKSLLKISGPDASDFLQGLITNDVHHFEDGSKSIYSMFLNNKGRILYDTLIHKWGDSGFLIECDQKIQQMLERHLRMFKLKRNIDIQDLSCKYQVWALTASEDAVPKLKVDPESSINIFKDPRLPDLGYRLLSSAHFGKEQIAEIVGKDFLFPENKDGYTYLRYMLGVSEGSDELPPGTRFPLEANCDYLHGVSFHKGCYIGQELMARVYYTGVIRKRFMPISFEKMVNDDIKPGCEITSFDNPKLKVGKLIGVLHDQGIALLKIKEALEARQLSVGNSVADVIKPSWWPIEAPKEKVTKTGAPPDIIEDEKEKDSKE